MTQEAFPLHPETPMDRPRRGTAFDVVFGIIVIVASGFSAYTTYLGFSTDLPWGLALALATLIGLGLVGVNFKIREAKLEGLSTLRPLCAFLVVFVFSFVSNTNAIYSFFIQRDIVGNTQEEAWRVFDAETTKIAAALASQESYNQYRNAMRQLETERLNLRKQITDSRNPGRGRLAQTHFDAIQRILGVPLTEQQPPPANAPPQELQAYADKVDRMIEAQVQIQFEDEDGRKIADLLTQIGKARAFYKNETVPDKYSAKTTDLMRQDLQTYAASARTVVDDITITPINSTADETGAFTYTWRNFVDWINPAAIVLSILLGALLDILPPLLSILLYTQDERY